MRVKLDYKHTVKTKKRSDSSKSARIVRYILSEKGLVAISKIQAVS